MSTMGERIRILRTNKKWKQMELANFIGVSSQVISNWERGYSSPDNEHVAKLAKVFNTSTDYLHGRVDDIFSDQLDMATRLNVLGEDNKDQTNKFFSQVPDEYVSFDIVKLLNSAYGITLQNNELTRDERELLVMLITSTIAKIREINQKVLHKVEDELDVKFFMANNGEIFR
ncbi:helix-turn-helix domain-containing protein [Paenibacillus sp. TAB 01]|uniref:helix-turn-helix domain-containing protein n=1 Tax=Paenibacillus sp. TAB 01 TaxID=3368988 RepID=UPI00374FDC26